MGAEILAKLPAFADTTTKMPELVSLVSEFAGTDDDCKNLEHPANILARIWNSGMSARDRQTKKTRLVSDEVTAINAMIAQLPEKPLRIRESQRIKLSKALKTRRFAPLTKVKRRLERVLGLSPRVKASVPRSQ